MAKIRVLHILWSAGIGGIEKLVYDLARTQRRNGNVEVEVLVCKEGGKYIQKFRQENISCHILGMKRAVDFSPAKASKLKSLFRRFNVLHFHSFNPWVAWFAGSSGASVVYTEHGNFAMGRKRTFSEKLNVRLQKIFLNTKVDFVSFNSRFSLEIATKRYGLKKTNSKVISNGIDFKNQPPADPSLIPVEHQKRMSGKFIVGTCSRFVVVKKIDRLINVFFQFRKNKPDALLLLCGDGPERENYEHLVRKLSLTDHTIFTGFNDHALAYQASMAVGVYPSRGEAFGLAALESLSLGVPVIVFSDGGGLTEIVSGISSEDVVADETALLHRMEHYYANRSAAGLMTQARKDYARKYDIALMESEFYNQYLELIS